MVYTIAIDGMGGDNAPKEIIEGVEAARDRYSDLEFLVFGDSKKISNYLKDSDRITIISTKQVIAMDEEPVKSIRTKKDSSLVQAANAVKDGRADALFSAGNTGALLASSIFIVGRIDGIDRPALLTEMPKFDSKIDKFVMMDVGANAENKPSHLYQYGLLGSFYVEHVFKYKKPVVRLLNNGGEEDKGDQMHKNAHQILKKNKSINFKGNIEARYLMSDDTAVVVTDGFNGNTALKSIEGTALTMLSLLKTSVEQGSFKTKLGGYLLKPALKSIRNELDYNNNGGAVILGVNAPVVKAHGSSKSVAVANTIGQTRTILESKLIKDVQKFAKTHIKQLQDVKQFDLPEN